MINIYRVRIMKILNINMPPNYYLIITEDGSEGKTECIEGLGCVGTESCVQDGVYRVGAGWECEFVDRVCVSRYECVGLQNGILVKSLSSCVESRQVMSNT